MVTIRLLSCTTQALFHDTIRNAYGPLNKALPLTLADSSYSRVEPEVPATPDAPKSIPPGSEAAKGIDYANVQVSAPASRPPASQRPLSEGVSSTGSPLDLEKLVYGKAPTDFRHPATVNEQRIIWLPKDPLGLVEEIEQDLDSQDISHTTEGAEMGADGTVDVTLAAHVRDVLTEA